MNRLNRMCEYSPMFGMDMKTNEFVFEPDAAWMKDTKLLWGIRDAVRRPSLNRYYEHRTEGWLDLDGLTDNA